MSRDSVGFVGLGRMGLPMARLLCRQFAVTAYDRRGGIEEPGLAVVDSLPDLVSRLPDRKVIWLMIPAAVVGEVVRELMPLLGEGDVVIDGGNSDFGDSVLHGQQLAEHGIHYVGVGCSGGVKGAADGPPMTVGCSGAALELVRPLLDALGGRYTHYDRPGFGHLAKGIHNAIEYGMMQSIAEGVALYFEHGFSQQQIIDTFELWQKGSIIESALVDTALACLKAHDFSEPRTIAQSETADMLAALTDIGVQTPAIDAAIRVRKDTASASDKTLTTLALMRHLFGGHETR